jgi:hypothetical protein
MPVNFSNMTSSKTTINIFYSQDKQYLFQLQIMQQSGGTLPVC